MARRKASEQQYQRAEKTVRNYYLAAIWRPARRRTLAGGERLQLAAGRLANERPAAAILSCARPAATSRRRAPIWFAQAGRPASCSQLQVIAAARLRRLKVAARWREKAGRWVACTTSGCSERLVYRWYGSGHMKAKRTAALCAGAREPAGRPLWATDVRRAIMRGPPKMTEGNGRRARDERSLGGRLERVAPL